MIEKQSVSLHPAIWKRVVDALEKTTPVLSANPHMGERLALYEHNEALAEISKVAKRTRVRAVAGLASGAADASSNGEAGGEQVSLPTESTPKRKRGIQQ